MASPRDLIGYDALQQEALRGVVRAALKLAAGKGLPGDHLLQITFKTNAPGVSGPADVFARFPDEMMIEFRPGQYRDLAPGETFFTVTLSFGGQPRSLSVPYAAIMTFRDPAVEYQLRFTVSDVAPEPVAIPATALPAADRPADGPNIVSLDHFRKK